MDKKEILDYIEGRIEAMQIDIENFEGSSQQELDEIVTRQAELRDLQFKILA